MCRPRAGAAGRRHDLRLRWFSYSTQVSEEQNGIGTFYGNAIPQVADYTEAASGFTPKFNVSWEPDHDLTVYATASKGFRPGGVNLPIPPQIGCALTSETYRPDSSWDYELGEKARRAQHQHHELRLGYAFADPRCHQPSAHCRGEPRLQILIGGGDIISAGYAWRALIYWAASAGGGTRCARGVSACAPSRGRSHGRTKLSDLPDIIPARTGQAIRMAQGEIVRVINLHGTQVVDSWAFCAGDPAEFMSMEHSRTYWLRANPRAGDCLLTNRRRPILTLMADTSPGVHDTLIAACDKARYEQLAGEAGHANCADNLQSALAGLGISGVGVPAPLNLFMNVAILDAGRLEFRAPVCAPGDYVDLRAERDLVMVFSACPQDMMPVNDFCPREVAIQVLDARDGDAKI